MMEWRPIAEASKYGGLIDLWAKNEEGGKRFADCRFFREYIGPNYEKHLNVWVAKNGAILPEHKTHSYEYKITHFMLIEGPIDA